MECLNECVYYDEIATSFTRLLHDSRDYIATLKHYKLPVPIEIDASGVMTLDQIANLAGKPISELWAMGQAPEDRAEILAALLVRLS